ncbi:MAG TPA: helix-turn-helix domain-containing protein [Myxococcota bacterium]|nr:helix-turn-helix domain-containing protein [Myxococcota bacterium]
MSSPVSTRSRKGTRRRRPAEEAQRAILDAAEQRLLAAGPDALRLQDVAADVGVSHPAILHHFGSREGLMQAVTARALATLEADLVRRLADPTDDVDGAALLDRVFETLGDRGHARLVAWLVLTGLGDVPPAAGVRVVRAVADLVHARRIAAGRATKADFEDSLFTIMLAATALFGDAIVGPQVRASAGLAQDRDADQRFRLWLAELLIHHLDRESPAEAHARGKKARALRTVRR